MFISSCSWWGDKGKSAQSTGVTLSVGNVLRFDDMRCIKNTGSFFSGYFQGRSSTSEIQSMKGCMESTIDLMFEFAYKDDAIGFNRARVKNVLSSVVGSSYEDSLDDLSDLLFRLKRFFIGGGKDSFFKEEWERFKPNLKWIADAFISSQGDAVELIFFSDRDKGLIEREGLYERLSQSFSTIDRIKNKYPKTLKIEEIEALLSSLLKVSNLDRFIPLIMAARQIIYPIENIFKFEQGSFLKTTWDVLEFQSRVREIDFGVGIFLEESLADFIKSLRILTRNFKLWSEAHPDTFSFNIDEVEKIILQMFEVEFLSNKMANFSKINESIKNILSSLFDGKIMTKEDFVFLSEIFEKWANYYPKLLEGLNLQWADNVHSVLKNDESFSSKNHETIDAMLNTFKKPRFVSASNNKLIHILYNDRRKLTQEESYFNKSLKHLFLTVAEPIIKAYSPEINEGLEGEAVLFDRKGMRRLFSEFRPIGLEFGFLSKYNCDSSGRAFIEANFLTRNANGDEYVSLFEATEWLGTMVVTANLTNYVFSRIDKKCAYGGQEGYGYPFYNRTCFQESLFNNHANLMNYFPGFMTYMQTLRSESTRGEFEKSIGGFKNLAHRYYNYNELNPEFFKMVFMNQMNNCFHAKEKKEYLDFPLSRNEFNGVVAVLIYVENFFAEYDKTGISGFFSSDPKGSDLIIDGQELSAFLKGIDESYLRIFARAIKKNWYWWGLASENFWVAKLSNLPETLIKLDRQRITDLIKNFMSDHFEVDQLEINFCNQVMVSAQDTGVITYDTGVALQCPIVE